MGNFSCRSLLIFILCCLTIVGCEETPEQNAPESSPAKIENAGSGLHRIILREEALKRIDLQTVAVRNISVKGVNYKVVPYSAVLYDPQGKSWVYINLKPLTFIRAEIDIAAIDGDNALLSNGPNLGIPVVSVGATELYGTEFLGSIQP